MSSPTLRSPDPVLVLAAADVAVRNALGAELFLDGFDVHPCASADATTSALERRGPELLILADLDRPGVRERLLRDLRAGRLRTVAANLPVITLGPGGQLDHLRAFEDGSDLHLPVDDALLLRAGVAAVRRRVAGAAVATPELAHDGLRVNPASRVVLAADGTAVDLSRLQFDLLRILASDPGRVFTKAELIAAVWHREPDHHAARALSTHVSRLRGRLAEHGHSGLVHTQARVGYRLAP